MEIPLPTQKAIVLEIDVLGMTKLYPMLRVQFYIEILGSVEYFIIAIIPRSTLTWSGNTY